MALARKQTTPDFDRLRENMVEHHIWGRGVRTQTVLDAMRNVQREAFLPHELQEFAYDDTPLPIDAEQTISQPYIVALMTEALSLRGGERVLEIGTGSGYAAAVLAEIAGEVYTVERIGQLAEKAATALADLGYDNVRVRHGDGRRGWPEHAPYDAIVVAAGGPTISDALRHQLKIGGRLVMPLGDTARAQELVRLTRIGENEFKREELADVRFVPMLGAAGWDSEVEVTSGPATKRVVALREPPLQETIARAAEPFDTVESADLAPLLERIGDARVVLLGEASHGSAEFYQMRARISRALIEQKGFNFVAIEGDWPDTARIDHYVRHRAAPPSEWTAFARFPTWMWRNTQVRDFVDWLHIYNGERETPARVAFHGLDLYSLYDSIRFVLDYLDTVDPEVGTRRTRTLWLPDAVAIGPGDLRSCRTHRYISQMRGRRRPHVEGPAG